MEEDGILLCNHNKSITSAEEAIDFNFNESTDSPDSVPGEEDLGVPFVHNLSRPFLPLDLLLVEGLVLSNAVSFKIDLYTMFNDIALHVNPRLDQNYIARNSMIEDKWGKEEGFALTRSPVKRGKPFQFQIFVLEKEYLVCVNGEHMFSYEHRVPPLDVGRIEIYGDIHLQTVSLHRSNVYPHPLRDRFKGSISFIAVPMTKMIKNGLGTFGKIHIEGRVKLLPSSFYINIQSSDLIYPHPKIIYHLNVRYSNDGYVVQNSWGLRTEWWDEEIRSPLPVALSPGRNFILSIITTNAYIQARGSDWDLPLFHHRLDPDQGLYVSVHGDVILNALQIFPDNDTLSVI